MIRGPVVALQAAQAGAPHGRRTGGQIVNRVGSVPSWFGPSGRYARRMRGASQPPEGTVALLFTDIVGSTRLAAKLRSGQECWPITTC